MTLVASYNLIESFPSSFTKINTLRYIDLSHNSMTGIIPDTFVNMTSLQYFDVGYNSLDGSIPPSLGNIKTITHFDTSNNLIGGDIPANFSMMSNLTYFDSSNNPSHTGWLPEFFRCLQLQTLDVTAPDNGLWGQIFGSIEYYGNLTQLQWFAVGTNQ